MSPKLLVTGGAGMLGSDIIPILNKTFVVHSTDRANLNIDNHRELEDFFAANRFDVVLHMAAITDLDWCETNIDAAFRTNARATGKIADLCASSNTHLIYISTSGVFSGNRGVPYIETDVPMPINVYGKSKFEGEKLAQANISPEKLTILRVGWLFGGGIIDKKFVRKMFELLQTRDKVAAVSDIFGSPNYSEDIGHAIVDIVNNCVHGLFHVQNSGEYASRFDIACEIKKNLDSRAEIEPIGADRFPTKAERPKMEAINSIFVKDALGYELRPWKDALAEYVSRLKRLELH